MESALQATDAVFVKAEPPEDECVQDDLSCEDVSIKTELLCVNNPLCESASIEIEVSVDGVCVKQEPSKTDGAAAAGLYAGRLENNELILEPVRGHEPAVERSIVATQGHPPKKKSSAKTNIFKCAHCEYETVHLLWLIRHTKKHCDKKSSNESTLNVQKQHRTVEIFKCGRIYAGTSKSNLLHDVKLYKCNQCSFACTQQDDLLKHKIVHTIKPGNPQKNLQVLERKNTREKAYKCSYCNDSFLEEVSWLVHKRKHTGEKLFKCDQCNYAGTHINHLLRHKAMHTNVILYKCSQCDFDCAKKDDLLNHKVLHINDQPFKCGECIYATDRKWRLRLHQATHTGEETYKCSTCDYTTLRQINLANHEARHAVKRYKCEKCGFACNRQYQLKNHERIHDEKLNKRVQKTHAHNGLRNYLSIQKDSAEDQPAPPLVTNNAVAKMEPEFVNESMWDDDDDGTNNDETNVGEDDSNMEMTGFDGSTTGDGILTDGAEGGAVGDAQDLPYKMIATRRGATLLMLHGHTYSYKEKNKRYHCSRLSSLKCKCFVKLDKMGRIVSLYEDHNHEPPRYMMTKSGLYMKVG